MLATQTGGGDTTLATAVMPSGRNKRAIDCIVLQAGYFSALPGKVKGKRRQQEGMNSPVDGVLGEAVRQGAALWAEVSCLPVIRNWKSGAPTPPPPSGRAERRSRHPANHWAQRLEQPVRE